MNDSELIAWCKEYAVEKRKEAECADYDHWRNSYIREADTFDAIAARLAQPTPESVVELARQRWPEAKYIVLNLGNCYYDSESGDEIRRSKLLFINMSDGEGNWQSPVAAPTI